MRFGREVLLKSFGNGVAMLRFQEEQTPESAAERLRQICMLASEVVVGGHGRDVYLLLEEGHPVTVLDVRNTDEEWEDLVASVNSRGSEAFRERVAALGRDRSSLA